MVLVTFLLRALFAAVIVGSVQNDESTTQKELRPEYIHPDGLLNFDPYLSDFKHEDEEDDYIPLPENDETIDGLPIFLLEPKNSYVLRTKPATLLCRAANALQVFFKCNDARIDKAIQLEMVDPHNGVRVVEAELNVTRNEIEEYFGGKYGCECYAWNSKGKIRSQVVFIEYAYMKKQFNQQPASASIEAGQTVNFHCDPPPAAPPATIKWMRNGQELEATDEMLVLPSVSLQDMANYSCVAENIAGRRESDVAVLTVYVNGGWSAWSSWSACCGAGRARSRSCSRPAPAHGGAPCRGPERQASADCARCDTSSHWANWSSWTPCDAACVKTRYRHCLGQCSGPPTQRAACDNCVPGVYSKQKAAIYVGVAVTVAVLSASAAILYVYCRKQPRPAYLAARTGIPKTYPSRDKGSAAPDLTRTCNEYWLQTDNQYDTPHYRNSYASPFGNRSRQQSSLGSNHYEMKPYSPSGESASSCYTNSRTLTSQSSGSASLAELVTTGASVTSHNMVDVAVTLPAASAQRSYRDAICLTVVK